jgi:mRNA interferase RelE/StbE
LVWTLEIDEKARKQLAKIAPREASRILSYMERRVLLLDNPRQLGDALQGSRFEHLWRYKVGDYRIICDIQDHKLVVLVVEIGHRSQIYR